MKSRTVRDRFAPAPTGLMHIGNARTALLNYLFAQQKDGTLVLRIEDTDPARNFDPSGTVIIKDLEWLGIPYQEGAGRGGPFAPYFQSERVPLYEQKLAQLKKEHKVYPCFCSEDELEKKRARQQALKMPPRYDRTCLALSPEEVEQKIADNQPFIWRLKLDPTQKITITDLARGKISFDYKHFTDFPVTRRDKTFTFMFANAIDDIAMDISHVFRGEDHLSNTAGQAAIYQALNADLPIFWHMPILCNVDGKKLSKRDKGFSLHDLRDAGYLPEAINNYLAIIGGSFKDEIMDLDQLATVYPFDNLSTAGQIKYDVDKLTWVNRQWIDRYDPQKLLELTKPFLAQKFDLSSISDEKLSQLLQIAKTEMDTLNDAPKLVEYYFKTPAITKGDVDACVSEGNQTKVKEIISGIQAFDDPAKLLDYLKATAKESSVPLKELFWVVRLALYGSTKGPGIAELVKVLGEQKAKKRIDFLNETLR